MLSIEVKNLEGQVVRERELAEAVFGAKPNSSLLWESVRAYLAGQRRGTHSTKSRGEVSGGGKKPWRQKGTGRARAGSSRSSLWRHGSIAHGPKPRDYTIPLPARMRRGALRSALAAKYQDRKLTVVEALAWEEVKTKAFHGALHKLGIQKPVLVVNDDANRSLELSSRNIAGCDLIRHYRLEAYDVLSHDGLLISESALARLEESLQ